MTYFFQNYGNSLGAGPDHSWEELNKIEVKRRELLNYEGTYSILVKYFRYTVFQYVFFDPLFWLTMSFFLTIRLVEAYVPSAERFIPTSDTDSTTVIGTFLGLILSYFVDNAGADHDGCHTNSKGAIGKIVAMATIGGTVLEKKSAEQVVRHLNAAHLLAYNTVDKDVYNRSNFLEPLNRDMHVLTSDEIMKLEVFDKDLSGGQLFLEVNMWAMAEIEMQFKEGEIDARTTGKLRDIVLDFNDLLAGITEDEPAVSFFRFHLVYYLCCIYLPLFAMEKAIGSASENIGFDANDVIACAIVMVQCCYVVGMKLLATKLTGPYSADLEDLSVLTYVRTACITSNNILHSKYSEELQSTAKIIPVKVYSSRSMAQ